jgi:hypothetical protein
VLSDSRRCRCPRVSPRCPSSLMSWFAAVFCSNQLLRGQGTRVDSLLLVCRCVCRGPCVAPDPRLTRTTLSAGLELVFDCCSVLEPCCDPQSVRKVGLLCYSLFRGSFLTGPYLAGFQLGLISSEFGAVTTCCSHIWLALLVCKAAGAAVFVCFGFRVLRTWLAPSELVVQVSATPDAARRAFAFIFRVHTRCIAVRTLSAPDICIII